MEDKQMLDRFYRVLVEEIRATRPDLLESPFTVAEIYQELVPYRTHRDRIGVEMNGDYEHLLLRLLSGEAGYLVLESEVARRELRSELGSPNPNTGVFRDFAAADVRLDPERIPAPGPAPRGHEGEDTVPVESLAPTPAPPERLPNDLPDWMDPSMDLDAVDRSAPDPQQEPVEAGAGDAVTCRWCREELPRRDGLNYCPFCGTDVHVVPCPGCGQELEPGWRFCIACGTEVVAD